VNPSGILLLFIVNRLALTLSGALIFFWAVPGLAQECLDPDGDGWGWDGSQSCVVTPQASVSSACVDSDGDGYGWDGSASCIVGAANSNQNQTTVQPSGTACVDPDGDGWGWNGSSSCLVTSPTGVQQITQPAAPAVTVPPVTSNGSFNAQRDLIALHFDHAPDRDDAHAAVAALMVRDQLGLTVNVVAGTYGEHSRDRYDVESEAVMRAVWGSEWLNAHSNFEGAVNSTVNRWAAVLGAGGSVWVAEGGPSDFTAEVVSRLRQRHTEFNTNQRIHVIQHSVWNEDHSRASALNYTRANTRYVFIADGNDPNATADLRFESHNNGSFVSRALSSSYSNEWAVAFGYLSPSDKLDFSDTVELLYILELGTDVIANVNDFGDVFF